MAEPLLVRNGGNPAATQRLQGLLNRVGAAILEDGDFGGGTERAVKYTQGLAGQAETGTADEVLWKWLKQQPEPSPLVPSRCIAFTVRHEVSSRETYQNRYRRPIWPKGSSGITIGIGYDLRFHPAEAFRARIDDAHLEALKTVEGVIGTTALADDLDQVDVPWNAAWDVFCEVSLTEFVETTKRTFENFEELPGLCRGAIVSLVYNRGASMRNVDSRREMREIRDLMQDNSPDALSQIPDSIRSMKRLWPELRGLQDRREDEADMFDEGLMSSFGG